MEYSEFRSEVQSQLRGYLPDELKDWEINFFKKYKVNEELDAVSVIPADHPKGTLRAYPVFYIQDLYDLHEAGNEMGPILRYVTSMLQTVPSPERIEKSKFQTDRLKDCVVFQLINYEKNTEYLKELPHRRFLDLAVIYRAVLFDENGMWNGMVVTDSIMKSWGLTEEELYEKAYKHTPEAFPFLMKRTEEAFPDEKSAEDFLSCSRADKIMYVVSTDSWQFGAAAFLYPEIMEQASAKYGGRSFMILPGSIHELYIISDPVYKGRHWKDTVQYANQNLVRAEEWLSDSVYYYNSRNKTITVLL